MTTYVLTYDLNKEQGSDGYKLLIGELERFSAHRYQASAWLVNATGTAKAVHDHFKQYIDANDSLWVSELTNNFDRSRAKHGTEQWLKDNPPSR